MLVLSSDLKVLSEVLYFILYTSCAVEDERVVVFVVVGILVVAYVFLCG